VLDGKAVRDIAIAKTPVADDPSVVVKWLGNQSKVEYSRQDLIFAAEVSWKA